MHNGKSYQTERILTVMSCPTLRGATRIQYISPQKEIDQSIEHAKKLYQQYAWINFILWFYNTVGKFNFIYIWFYLL